MRAGPVDVVSAISEESAATSTKMSVSICDVAIRLVSEGGVVSSKAICPVFFYIAERVLS